MDSEKPVSLSYTNLMKCFPELKNEAWSTKVDLEQVKDEADAKFVTSKTLLRYREAVLKDSAGQQKRLRLSATPGKKGKPTYVLSLEKLDAKGAGTPIDLPQSLRINPREKDVGQYFLNQDVISDESSYFDTKLKGMSLSYKRGFKEIFELELSDPRGHRRLFCEDKKDLGVVCTCFQK